MTKRPAAPAASSCVNSSRDRARRPPKRPRLLSDPAWANPVPIDPIASSSAAHARREHRARSSRGPAGTSPGRRSGVRRPRQQCLPGQRRSCPRLARRRQPHLDGVQNLRRHCSPETRPAMPGELGRPDRPSLAPTRWLRLALHSRLRSPMCVTCASRLPPAVIERSRQHCLPSPSVVDSSFPS